MKKNKILLGGFLFALLFSSCSKDDFAKKNTDPSLVDPSIPYLFTEGLRIADPQEYQQWYYNNSQYYLPFNQSTTVSTTLGNSALLSNVSAVHFQYAFMTRSKSNYEQVKVNIAKLSEADAARYKHLEKMFEVINIYMGINGTDPYGSAPYTEMGSAIANSANLTPAYQTQEELFTLWLSQLDTAIDILNSDVMLNGEKVVQYAIGKQDFVYDGNAAKWAKFANSLKLKIAIRLLNVDKARALKIAEQVASSSVGYMNALSDDYIWNPGSQFYHFDNDINFGVGTDNLLSFLVENQDPRVRFIFNKNGYSADITAQFIKEGKSIPTYIANNVNYVTDASGQKQFGSWKSPGEPWVRYYGMPLDAGASSDAKYSSDYFSPNTYKLKSTSGSEFSYLPFSVYSQQTVTGTRAYTYPTLPNANAVRVDQKQAYYSCFLSSAETNLYLAEFKLLGANIPGSADSYYKKGVEFSVELLDYLSKKNNIPYYAERIAGLYDDPSNNTSESIALKSGEVTALLAKADYQLTGSVLEQLEKVYIQQYIHFLYLPNEQFVTVRRSGVPTTNSTVLARKSFNGNVIIPRRLLVETSSPTDPMGPIRKAAFDAEGFTQGTEGGNQALATQRVWYDKSAPAYGAGPNM